jgi:hypothetical protein
MKPSDEDLAAFGKLYGYEDPHILILEFAVVPKLEEASA